MKIFDYRCSFKTIPNGLRQHPLSVAIIYCVSIGALRGQLPITQVAIMEKKRCEASRNLSAGSKINLFIRCQIRVALRDFRLKGQCLIFRRCQRRHEIGPADGTAIGFVRHRTVIFIRKNTEEQLFIFKGVGIVVRVKGVLG